MIKIQQLNLILFLSIFLFSLTGCVSHETDSSKAIEVETVRVRQIDLSDELELNGIVNAEPDQSTKIVPLVPGLLVWIGPKVGDKVHKYQLVARLQNSVQVAQVEQAQAILDAANANLVNTKKIQERTKTLYEERIAAGKDVDLAVSQQQAAQAQSAQALASLNQAKASRDFTQITSPIDGIVAERYLNVGDQPSPSTPIFLIINPETVIIQANLPVSYNSDINPGQEVSILAPGVDKPVSGKVLVEGIKVDPISNSLPIQIKAINPENILKIGMLVKIKILLGVHKSALVISKECLIGSSEDSSKFFVNKVLNGESIPTYIKTGISSNGDIEIMEGLKVGDLIIKDVGYELPKGTKVQINGK